jgi:hypothetical protein
VSPSVSPRERRKYEGIEFKFAGMPIRERKTANGVRELEYMNINTVVLIYYYQT